MKYRNLFQSLLLIILLTGCSIYHIDSQESTLDYYPSKGSIEDVVYMEDITEPHEVIGRVTVNAERRQSIEDVINKMRREAAILGGDAITNIQTDATGTWKKLPAQQVIGNAYIRANFSATVVTLQ